MKRKNQTLQGMAPFFVEKFGKEKGERIVRRAWNIFEMLKEENAGETKPVKKQTHEKIYPVMALLRASLEEGEDRQEIVNFLDKKCSQLAEKEAGVLRKLLKIPGLYRLMPYMFKLTTKKVFGENAGFHAKFYDMGKGRCKFDMTKCLYCDVCRKYDCMDIVPCFCHTDDVTDGHMHPLLKWNRTKVMGEGADVCDFDLLVVPKSKGRRHLPSSCFMRTQ